MDASDAVAKLHEVDPAFRDICETLYPGLNPAEVADQVYGISKGNPDQADVHVPTTQWRNGRGHTKGRGRRKIDADVKETRFVKRDDDIAIPKNLRKIPSSMKKVKTEKFPDGVKESVKAVRDLSKSLGVQHAPGSKSNPERDKKLAIAGLGATGVAAVGGMHALHATARNMKADQAAVKAGTYEPGRVMRRLPKMSPKKMAAIGAGGWLGLHGVELAADGLAARAQVKQYRRANEESKKTTASKAWDEAQAMIVDANQRGMISKADALDLAQSVYEDLSKALADRAAPQGVKGLEGVATKVALLPHTAKGRGRYARKAAEKVHKTNYGHDIYTSSNIKLQSLKAPPPVKLDAPKLTPTTTTQPKSVKSGAGASGKPSKQGVKKLEVDPDAPRSLDITGEISKLNEDKQQCFGWCSVVKVDGRDVIDKQNDMIDIDDIELAAYDYMLTSRKGGDMHRRTADGGPHHAADCIESFVLTPEKIEKMDLPEGTPQGWWIGMQVHDENLWDDVKSGRKTKFSIHGSGLRTQVMVDD